MPGQECPDDIALAALVNNALPDADAERLRAHLGRCDECRELVAALVAPAVASTLAAAPSPPPTEPQSASEAPSTPSSLRASGTRVGRYVILGVLGRGGMGVVYRAHDPDLGRRVALKLVRADTEHHAALRQRLIREAQAMASITHTNVVTVYDTGTVGDEVFIAMALIEGGTLGRWLATSRRPWRDVLACFVAAGRGLAAAHSVNLVHRDFKPENVLTDDAGHVWVTDFGLARPPLEEPEPGAWPSPLSPEVTPRLTQTGAAVGTPAYMAPEQVRGQAIDARADQFSFCVALYEALWGALPFAVSGRELRLAAIERGAPARKSGPPAWLYRVVTRGLRARPEDRWQSMDALLAALTRDPTAARRRWAALITVLAGAGAALALWRPGRSPTAIQPQVVVRAVRRLTFTPGCEQSPSFTPDGRTLVFAHDEAERTNLFAHDLASGSTRRLWQSPGFDDLPAVSPDGRRVAYVHDGEGARQLRVLPLDGSEAPRTLALLPHNGKVAWLSPSTVVALDADANVSRWNVDTAGAPALVQRAPPGRPIGTLSTFADGAVAIDWDESGDRIGLGVLDRAGIHVLVEHVDSLDGGVLAAPSQQAIYFPRRRGALKELVRVPRQGGELEVVGGGVAPSYGVTISGDSSKLAFSTCAYRPRLVRIDGAHQLQPLLPTGDWADTLPVSVDERRLLFASDRTGVQQLFLVDVTRDEAVPVSAGAAHAGAASYDRRWLAYASPGPRGIWLRALDAAAPPRRLSDGDDDTPVFTRDGRQVVFARGAVGDQRLWIVAVDGGAARPLLATPSSTPMTAADDDRILFVAPVATGKQVMITDAAGRAPAPAAMPVLERSSWSFSRSRDGRRILYVRAGHEIVEARVDSPAAPVVQHRLPRWLESASYAADDRETIAAVDFGEGDLWLADGRFP